MADATPSRSLARWVNEARPGLKLDLKGFLNACAVKSFLSRIRQDSADNFSFEGGGRPLVGSRMQ